MANDKKLIQQLDEDCTKWLENFPLLESIKKQLLELSDGVSLELTPAIKEVVRLLTTPPDEEEEEA